MTDILKNYDTRPFPKEERKVVALPAVVEAGVKQELTFLNSVYENVSEGVLTVEQAQEIMWMIKNADKLLSEAVDILNTEEADALGEILESCVIENLPIAGPGVLSKHIIYESEKPDSIYKRCEWARSFAEAADSLAISMRQRMDYLENELHSYFESYGERGFEGDGSFIYLESSDPSEMSLKDYLSIVTEAAAIVDRIPAEDGVTILSFLEACLMDEFTVAAMAPIAVPGEEDVLTKNPEKKNKNLDLPENARMTEAAINGMLHEHGWYTMEAAVIYKNNITFDAIARKLFNNLEKLIKMSNPDNPNESFKSSLNMKKTQYKFNFVDSSDPNVDKTIQAAILSTGFKPIKENGKVVKYQMEKKPITITVEFENINTGLDIEYTGGATNESTVIDDGAMVVHVISLEANNSPKDQLYTESLETKILHPFLPQKVDIYHGSFSNEFDVIKPNSFNMGTKLSTTRSSSYWFLNEDYAKGFSVLEIIHAKVNEHIPMLLDSDYHALVPVEYKDKVLEILESAESYVYVKQNVDSKLLGSGQTRKFNEFTLDIPVKPDKIITVAYPENTNYVNFKPMSYINTIIHKCKKNFISPFYFNNSEISDRKKYIHDVLMDSCLDYEESALDSGAMRTPVISLETDNSLKDQLIAICESTSMKDEYMEEAIHALGESSTFDHIQNIKSNWGENSSITEACDALMSALESGEDSVNTEATISALGIIRDVMITESACEAVLDAAEFAEEMTEGASKEDIDPDIKSTIELLNRLGYKTKYSSAGHREERSKDDRDKNGVYYGKLYTTARITFDGNYKFGKLPKGWYQNFNSDKTAIYVKPFTYDEKNGSPDEAFAKWRTEYISALKDWAENLKEAKDTKVEESVELFTEGKILPMIFSKAKKKLVKNPAPSTSKYHDYSTKIGEFEVVFRTDDGEWTPEMKKTVDDFVKSINFDKVEKSAERDISKEYRVELKGNGITEPEAKHSLKDVLGSVEGYVINGYFKNGKPTTMDLWVSYDLWYDDTYACPQIEYLLEDDGSFKFVQVHVY